MRLSLFGIIKAEDISDTSIQAPVPEEDNTTSNESGVDEAAVGDKQQVKRSRGFKDMASLPKIPRSHHRTARTTTAAENDDTSSKNDTTSESVSSSHSAPNIIVDESGPPIQLEQQTPKIHDLPLIPESPNIIDTDKTEITAQAEHITGTFGSEFRHFLDERSIEEQFPMAAPLLIGGLVGIPAFMTIRNIRRRGLVNYFTKAPLKTKLFQLLVMGSGVAASTYYYKKPRQTRYEKDFKDV